MKQLGKKIVIVGPSAAGKSTFARALAEKLSLSVIHTDALMWKPGWNYVGDEQSAQKLLVEIKQPEWIVEGYIVKGALHEVFTKADTIILLDYNPVTLAYRYIKRCWLHRRTPRLELPDSPDTFSWSFLRTVVTKKELGNRRSVLTQNSEKLITLYSPKAAKMLLKQFTTL